MGILTGVANWLGARGVGTPPDPHIAQARRDQKMAVTPGCVDGHMECGDQICGCDEDSHCAAFVTTRAEWLRRQEFERLNMITPWPNLTLPRAVLRERGTTLGDLISAASCTGVYYNIGQVRDMVEMRWPEMNKDEVEFVMDAGRGLDVNWDLGNLPPDRTDTVTGRAQISMEAKELVGRLGVAKVRGMRKADLEGLVSTAYSGYTFEEQALLVYFTIREVQTIGERSATPADSLSLPVDTAREGVDTDASDGGDGD